VQPSSVAAPSRGELVDDMVAAVDIKGLAGDESRGIVREERGGDPTSSILTTLRSSTTIIFSAGASPMEALPQGLACELRVEAQRRRTETSSQVLPVGEPLVSEVVIFCMIF
jgi:hypothetical protein